ncbi:hypothetical protein Q5P01_009507 [Channa striata]|uniref:Uncharacterized protein n=1 Tax=Channa striata TaxID=64152 RepID=A0AA88MW01_CHASR|nr:hypothetical protein Q5P01_009507 [Channa striata]
MQFCGCLLVSGLLSIAVLCSSTDCVRVQHRPQHIDGPMSGSPGALWLRTEGSKEAGKPTVKLLRLDDMGTMENDVMEPKRKRSFPGNNAPLDRLSISSMETKQVANKQSKVVELPRRRLNPPPIDRIELYWGQRESHTCMNHSLSPAEPHLPPANHPPSPHLDTCPHLPQSYECVKTLHSGAAQ